MFIFFCVVFHCQCPKIPLNNVSSSLKNASHAFFFSFIPLASLQDPISPLLSGALTGGRPASSYSHIYPLWMYSLSSLKSEDPCWPCDTNSPVSAFHCRQEGITIVFSPLAVLFLIKHMNCLPFSSLANKTSMNTLSYAFLNLEILKLFTQ